MLNSLQINGVEVSLDREAVDVLRRAINDKRPDRRTAWLRAEEVAAIEVLLRLSLKDHAG